MEKRDVERQIRAIGGEGIVTPEDLSVFCEQRWRVFKMMSDGRWYTRPQIEAAARGADGLRRMRQLRDVGIVIPRRRIQGTRTFVYRISGIRGSAQKPSPPPQGSLF